MTLQFPVCSIDSRCHHDLKGVLDMAVTTHENEVPGEASLCQ
jgi:hypothetical protein